mgnify:CR=1 FL=1
MQLEERSKNYHINYKILMAEIEMYRDKLWERSRFCECGADSLKKCGCDTSKKESYRRRANRKVNEKFEERLDAALEGNLPLI